MAGLHETISAVLKGKRLSSIRRGRSMQAFGQDAGPTGGGSKPLVKGPAFGANPGNLDLFEYLPDGLQANAPLVVALHGCLQDAAGFDLLTQWSALADAHGFAVLFPQQSRANNPNNCFNWFDPGDSRRDSGEARSVRQMIEAMIARHGLDPERVYISGFSAGGAMTCAMLAAYPEVFAGGAILAGLPYGCASNVNEALMAMAAMPDRSAGAWGDAVRSAAPRPRRWPRVSIWHGSADRTVAPAGATALARQWVNVHGLTDAEAIVEDRPNYRRRSWRDEAGETLVDVYVVPGMGHAIAFDNVSADAGRGSRAYAAPVGVDAIGSIARSWGLLGAERDGKTSDTQEKAKASIPILNQVRTLLLGKAPDQASTAVEPVGHCGESDRLGRESDRLGHVSDWVGDEWQVEPGDILVGRAVSRLDFDPAPAIRVTSAEIVVSQRSVLTYERKLDFHAGVNIFTSASFVVAIDGVEIDRETVVFHNRSDESWVMRRIELGDRAGGRAILSFEVNASSNVFVEARATALVRHVAVVADDAAASRPAHAAIADAAR